MVAGLVAVWVAGLYLRGTRPAPRGPPIVGVAIPQIHVPVAAPPPVAVGEAVILDEALLPPLPDVAWAGFNDQYLLDLEEARNTPLPEDDDLW